jgi:hypothetical protein
MQGSLGPVRRIQFGISSNDQLLDPAMNAAAAYSLWGGNDNNLNTAWMINTNTAAIPYATRYQAFLNALPPSATLESSYAPGALADGNGNIPLDASVGAGGGIVTLLIGGAVLWYFFK